MEHYSRVQWLLYLEDRLLSIERISMEKHLQICDHCLETYLTSILPGDVEEVEKRITPGFKGRLLQAIHEEPSYSKKKTSFCGSGRLLQYYAVAAAITVLLMAGGWFDLLAEEVPKSKAFKEEISSRVERRIPFGWSERIVDLTTVKIDKIVGLEEGDN